MDVYVPKRFCYAKLFSLRVIFAEVAAARSSLHLVETEPEALVTTSSL
jgi:hypothetical protein